MIRVMAPLLFGIEAASLVQQAGVVLDAQAKVSQDLAQQRPDDDLRTVVGDYHDPALGVSEDVVAALPPDPVEARQLRHSGEFAVGYEAQATHV